MVSVFRRWTSICCMTFRAVRSRCITLARERRVETSAGEKGYVSRKEASSAPR